MKFITILVLLLTAELVINTETKIDLELKEYVKIDVDSDLKDLDCYNNFKPVCMDPHLFNKMKKEDGKTYEQILKKMTEALGTDKSKILGIMKNELNDTKQKILKNANIEVAEYAKTNKIYTKDSLTSNFYVAQILALDDLIKKKKENPQGQQGNNSNESSQQGQDNGQGVRKEALKK